MYKMINKKICNDLTREICDYNMISIEDVKNNFKSLMLELWVHHMVSNLYTRNMSGMLI